MTCPPVPCSPPRNFLAGALLLALVVPAAQAQTPFFDRTRVVCPAAPTPPVCAQPCPIYPGLVPPPVVPQPPPVVEPKEKEKQGQAAEVPPREMPSAADMTPPESPTPAGTAFAALGGTGVAAPGGYLDSAIPMNQFRVRYDAGFGMNRPDRATYFYAPWQEMSFHPHGILNKNGSSGGVFFDPSAHGPEQLPGSLDYQEVSTYLELAPTKRFSVFADLPFRFLNFRNLLEEPDQPDNRLPPPGFFSEPGFKGSADSAPDNRTGGLSDLQLGFKYAFVADPCEYLTFQFRTYLPTGDTSLGLGTGHVSLEPSLLLYERWNRLVFQGQAGIWVPIDGGPMAGNVTSYGLGLAYDVYRSRRCMITPVAEVFGYTVLNGFESIGLPSTSGAEPAPGSGLIPTPPDGTLVPTTHGVRNAAGDTIVDLKIGTRVYFPHGQDMYMGYGHAVTGDRWYRDLFRVEYRITF